MFFKRLKDLPKKLRLIPLEARLLLALLGLIATSYFYPFFFLLSFVFYPFVFFASKNLSKSIVLLVYNLFFSLGVLVVGSSILSISSLGINFINILVIYLLLNLFIFYKFKSVKRFVDQITHTIPAQFNYLIALFSILVVVFVVSLLHFLPATSAVAPLTHDPQAHAYYTKIIHDTGQAQYFYSPGFHILSFFIHSVASTNFALSVHLLTYFSIGLAGLGIGTFSLWATKSKLFAMMATGIYLCLPTPWLLPITAGKNALVLAGAFLLFVLFNFHLTCKIKSRVSVGVFFFSLLALGLMHYPVFAYGLAIPIIFLFAEFIITKLKKQKVDWKSLKQYILGFLLITLLIFIWIKANGSEYTNLDRVNGKGEVYQLGATDSFKIPWADLPSHATRTFSQVVKEYRGQLNLYSDAFSYLLLGSIVILFAFYKKFPRHNLYVLSIVGGLFILPFFVRFIQSVSLDTTADSGPLISFISLPLLCAGALYFLTTELIKAKRLKLGVTLMIFSALIASTIYVTAQRNTFQNRRYSNGSATINGSDAEAYQWIKDEVNPTEKFLVDAYPGKSRSFIIFAQPSGLWLPVFTNSKTSAPFELGQFATKASNDNYRLYEKIKNKDRSAEEALKILVSEGYVYYYHSQALSKDLSLDPQFMKKFQDISVTPAYENKLITIYRLQLKY